MGWECDYGVGDNKCMYKFRKETCLKKVAWMTEKVIRWQHGNVL
jgi:hypothetical protein